MSTATATATNAVPAARSGGRAVLVAWAIAAIVLLIRAQVQPAPLLGDADDAMRMIEAVDLLNGQAWQDTMQYRDNTPYGASMHWSRLIDAPIALIMAIAAPFAGAEAPRVAAMIWPVLLLLPMLALSLALTRKLVPDTDLVTPLVLPLVSLVLLVEFIPGRVDHHNVQILLCLVMALCLVALRGRVLGGAIVGIAAATSLAIGMETLPVLAVVTAILVLLWVTDPLRHHAALAAYGVALGLGALGHFLLATPPENYATTACDALSVVYVLPAMLGGGFLAGGAWLAARLAARWQRLAVMMALGAAVAATAALLFPHCLAGPYADVHGAMAHYFDDIAEAHPLWTRLMADPSIGVSFTLAALVAIPLTALRAWRETGERRVDWMIMLALLVAASVVMVLQIRGARIAAPFAIPAAAWLITVMRQRYLAGPTTANALKLLGTWLLFAGVAHYAVILSTVMPFAASTRTPSGGTIDQPRFPCIHESAHAELAALPTGRVLIPFRLGPHVLLNTPHSVVATGFHRNTQGMVDTEAFFAGDEDQARQIAGERGITYVVLCPSIPDYDRPVGPAHGQHWSWLEPLTDPDEALQIYRVTL